MKRSSSHFSPVLPVGKEWFSTAEAASILGRTPQHIRRCFDAGSLPGHRVAARASNGATRYYYQFHRDALLLYLLETANYTPEDFAERLADLIRNRAPEEMSTVMKRAGMVLMPERN